MHEVLIIHPLMYSPLSQNTYITVSWPLVGGTVLRAETTFPGYNPKWGSNGILHFLPLKKILMSAYPDIHKHSLHTHEGTLAQYWILREFSTSWCSGLYHDKVFEWLMTASLLITRESWQKFKTFCKVSLGLLTSQKHAVRVAWLVSRFSG